MIKFKAVEVLFHRHPGESFVVNLGASRGTDIVSESEIKPEVPRISAEVFATVNPNNNAKLKTDIKRIMEAGPDAEYRYVFFASLGAGVSTESDGVTVMSFDAAFL